MNMLIHQWWPLYIEICRMIHTPEDAMNQSWCNKVHALMILFHWLRFFHTLLFGYSITLTCPPMALAVMFLRKLTLTAPAWPWVLMTFPQLHLNLVSFTVFLTLYTYATLLPRYHLAPYLSLQFWIDTRAWFNTCPILYLLNPVKTPF